MATPGRQIRARDGFCRRACPVFLLLLLLLLAAGGCSDNGEPPPGRAAVRALVPAMFLNPRPGAVFPRDIAPPVIRWRAGSATGVAYEIRALLPDGGEVRSPAVTGTTWRMPAEDWERAKTASLGAMARMRLYRLAPGADAAPEQLAETSFRTSPDAVEAPLFYREVNLPFEQAVADPSHICWRFGSVSAAERPPVVLENLPVCGNCHSFSADGAVLGMDIDYANDKGSYAVTEVRAEIELSGDAIVSWSDYRRDDGRSTFGLLSRVSPDGRYVVSTVKDRSVFIPRPNLAFSQLFFPIRGILVVYDRQTRAFRALPGADDPEFVQSNPTWSPDGRWIVFARAKAEREGGESRAVLLRPEECTKYTADDAEFRFDLYRIPFNDGDGGVAEALAGASDNGVSNYFARYSPDGRWIVFCKAGNFMLLQPDSELWVIPAAGGEGRRLACNTTRMNSWHSWSPNGKWLVFSGKPYGPYTKLFLAHMDEEADSDVPVELTWLTAADRAANIPEFVNAAPDAIRHIREGFLDDYSFYRAGFERHREGDLARAETNYAKALELNPDHVETSLLYGELKENQGDMAAAVQHYRNALRVEPRFGMANLRLGVLLLCRREFKEAETLLLVAAEVGRADPRPVMALGVLYEQTNRPSLAEKNYRLAVGRAPEHADAHCQLARCLHTAGRPREAVAEYRQTLALDSGALEGLVGLASVLTDPDHPEMRAPAEAAALLGRACEITSDSNVPLLRGLAAASAQAGRNEDAVEASERAINSARRSGNDALVKTLREEAAAYREAAMH